MKRIERGSVGSIQLRKYEANSRDANALQFATASWMHLSRVASMRQFVSGRRDVMQHRVLSPVLANVECLGGRYPLAVPAVIYSRMLPKRGIIKGIRRRYIGVCACVCVEYEREYCSASHLQTSEWYGSLKITGEM